MHSFGKWWWAVVIDYMFGVVGVYQTVTGITKLSQIGWAIIFILAFTIPPFIAFNRIRKQRDGLAQQIKENLEATRPRIVVGQNIGVLVKPDDAKGIAHILIHPSFCNTGQKPAYQVSMRSGFAPVGFPMQFQTMPDLNLANPIGSKEDFGPEMKLGTHFRLVGKERQANFTELLIYCGFQYSDAPKGKKKYEDEWWFIYPLGAQTLAYATIEQKEALESYVRKAYSQATTLISDKEGFQI